MALIKIKNKNGFDCSYWRIVQICSNFDRQDAIITISLYKDKATRDADPNQVMHSFSYDLDGDFFDEVFSGEDNLKNIRLSKAYKILKDKAITEAEKTEDKNEDLAFFADATDDV